MTTEEKAIAHVRKMFGITEKRDSQVGEIPNNHLAYQNGLDEIDLWAMKEGNAQRTINNITPDRHHIKV